MTISNHDNIERKLNHVLQMGENIINMYRHITCTERVSLMLAMTAAVKQVCSNMRNVAAYLRKNLLDEFRIDYILYARKIEDLLKIWREELKGAPIFHNLDTLKRPITNPDEIVLKEDTDYDMTIKQNDEDDFNFKETRIGLLKNATLMCESIEDGLEQMSRILRGISSDYQNLKEDVKKQDDCLNKLEELYEEAMWEDDKKRLIGEVKEFIVLCNNSNNKDTFELFLERMDRQATDPHDIMALAELNEWYLSGQRPAGFIVENRDRLSFEDIARHFCFVRGRNLVSRKVESFDLLQPADDDYKDLFVNKASQELIFLLVPTLESYVDFKRNYQFAALQMAMMDLGLVYNDRGNGIQMRDFTNSTFLQKSDKTIKDQTTLTQWTGKLLGGMFGAMDEQHLKGNYGKDDFEKMKDYYWLCLSIINKVVQLDLEELQFAPYLYEDHEKTPNITDYRNNEGQSIMERLSILKSVIKGETLFK